MVDFKSLVPWLNNKAQTPAVREDYFDPFVTFRREMDRMFDHFFDGFSGRSSNGPGAVAPAINLDETEKEMVLTAELPGVTDKDIALATQIEGLGAQSGTNA